MRTIARRAAALALALMLTASGAAALGETLRVQGLSQRTLNFNEIVKQDAEWYTAYVEAHPEINLKVNPKYNYRSTKSMMKALDKRELATDVFALRTYTHNTQRFMDEGYCAELSGSAELSEIVGQMYAPIADVVTRNGVLYGVPISLMVREYLHCDPEAWASLGLTEEEKPRSFTGLLDFLETWPGRFATRPNVSLTYYWDAEHCDDKHAYTRWLVGLLVRHYARQQEFLGREVDFDTPEFTALLERAKTVGDALYGHDGLQEAGALFNESTGDIGGLRGFIPLRMTDDDPVFIAAEIFCLCVDARSERKEAAMELIASYMNSMLAHEPDPQNPTEEDYDMLQEHTALFASLGRPLVSGDGSFEMDEAELARYHELAQYFYFPMPGGFDSYAGGTNDIRSRYAQGKLTAAQYITRLNKFAGK